MTRYEEILQPANLSLPARPVVERIEAEEFTDSVGELSVGVTVFIADATPDEEASWRAVEPITNAIRAALAAAGVGLFAYVTYRMPTDVEQLREAS